MGGVILYGDSPTVDEIIESESADSFDVRTLTDYSLAGVRDMLLTVEAPPVGRTWIMLLPEAQLLSELCQNVLLKALEDRDDLLFIFKSSKTLLPTVESRCRIYVRDEAPEEEFRMVLSGRGQFTDAEMHCLYVFCRGDMSLMNRISNEGSLVEVLKKFADIPLASKKELLKLFCMMREKDPAAFPAVYKEYIKNVILVMLDRIANGEAGDKKVVEDHLMRVHTQYTTGDFFDLLINI